MDAQTNCFMWLKKILLQSLNEGKHHFSLLYQADLEEYSLHWHLHKIGGSIIPMDQIYPNKKTGELSSPVDHQSTSCDWLASRFENLCAC